MLKSIRAVAGGEAVFGPAIAARLLKFFQNTKQQMRKEPIENAFPDLTEREREVLACIARGDTNSEIADQLTISLKTVRNHVSNIFSKLQVADRAQAVIKAREAGLGK